MVLENLTQHYTDTANQKLEKKYEYLFRLFSLVTDREISSESLENINACISRMNVEQKDAKTQLKALCRQQTMVLRHLEKNDRLVVRNHYRNTWLALGMAAIGLPIGAAIGTSQGNMSLMGYGMSLGMVFGLIFGSIKDKKAAKDGRQLDIELQP